MFLDSVRFRNAFASSYCIWWIRLFAMLMYTALQLHNSMFAEIWKCLIFIQLNSSRSVFEAQKKCHSTFVALKHMLIATDKVFRPLKVISVGSPFARYSAPRICTMLDLLYIQLQFVDVSKSRQGYAGRIGPCTRNVAFTAFNWLTCSRPRLRGSPEISSDFGLNCGPTHYRCERFFFLFFSRVNRWCLSCAQSFEVGRNQYPT